MVVAPIHGPPRTREPCDRLSRPERRGRWQAPQTSTEAAPSWFPPVPWYGAAGFVLHDLADPARVLGAADALVP